MRRSRAGVVTMVVMMIAGALQTSAQTPGAIHVDQQLQPVVVHTLEVSETFRKQWQRITLEPLVVMYVYLGKPPADSTRRAKTDMKRYSTGLLHAVVEIPPDDDYVELLAHEFEHVIEQIERVNLRALARRGNAGVHEREDGAFETVRAQQAGLAAAHEAAATAFRTRWLLAFSPTPSRPRPEPLEERRNP